MQLIQLNNKLQESNKSLLVQNVREEQHCSTFPTCNVQSTTEKRWERVQTKLAHYGDTVRLYTFRTWIVSDAISHT